MKLIILHTILIFGTFVFAAEQCPKLFLPNTRNLPMTQKNRATDEISATQIIEYLKMQPLPNEGGFFSETYKSKINADPEYLKHSGFSGARNSGSAIYYLITKENFSALHRLKQDEIFHFYSGSSAEMLQIFPDGSFKLIRVGTNILNGEVPQILVPSGVWQATKVLDGGKWTLLGTTCHPGFEYVDFELAHIDELSKKFPHIEHLIRKFNPHEAYE